MADERQSHNPNPGQHQGAAQPPRPNQPGQQPNPQPHQQPGQQPHNPQETHEQREQREQREREQREQRERRADSAKKQSDEDREKRLKQYEDRLKGRPTPTQEELDQIALGHAPEQLSEDGSGPDPAEELSTVHHIGGEHHYEHRQMRAKSDRGISRESRS
jgi:hypothetical protein